MPTPRPPLASSLDDYIAKVIRLIRRRASQRARTEITIVILDGTPERIKENRQTRMEDLIPEQW